ncbi:MAG: DUF4397 domain-containing protein [Sphingobacteriales bacterium]|nr:MAG: DUF4397 domain-containing protein [Sphingobacteriales bacterium]
MKKLFNTSGSLPLSFLSLFLSVIMFTACSKNDNNDFPNQPAAGLMTVNLAIDKAPIAFTLSSNQVGGLLGYSNFSGGYVSIYPGSRELRSVDAGNGSTITQSTNTYVDSNYYSAFLLGTAGNYRHVVVEDKYREVVPVSGKAWVRYINAIPDTLSTPNVTIAGNTQAAAYGTVSPFVQVDAGAINTAIKSEAVDTTRSITVSENKIYTILFMGIPGATDPAKAVQIKFIENGTASN